MTGIHLRPAALSDCRRLFDWLNLPASLATKLATREPVPWETHRDWFARRLGRDDVMIRIIEDDGDAPLGQVRLERRGDAFEVDVFVAPDRQGAGVAGTALAAALDEASDRWPGAQALARVLPGNQRSLRLFTGAGFTPLDAQSDHMVLGRRLDRGTTP